ncbi:prephenate dehydratase [Pedococcus dokdonensis]|uniref:Prephenate dehydratase n=1 Tax=Pedococcus dokdonensis TaxID=443156 RepID=A0A1H0TQ75_9MICO|nr:prephenate dehydratase [Pedococcus dokdonensis]SDP56212.1 prephenate dehydratase [Pedococcus dokdonensis]
MTPTTPTIPTSPTRHGYFGPEGTFTQMALHAWAPAAGQEHVPLPSVEAALNALRAGEVDAAMVPIENSVEGGVSATLDALASGDPLVVVGEVLVPITFVLAARPGVPLGEVRAVGTHSHAWAQVRGWMGTHLPDAVYVPTLSTAAAAAGLVGTDGEQAAYQAAVCAPVAARNLGLEVLAEGIGDNAAAVTRFVSVARPGQLPERTGADKTTLVLFQRDDHAGGLLELLEQFAVRGINMSRLESRPTKSSMGDYCFSIDIEGHVLDERVGEALLGLKRVCADVRFLGSYPAAHGTAVRVTPHTSDAAFGEARAWLHSLRGT